MLKKVNKRGIYRTLKTPNQFSKIVANGCICAIDQLTMV